MREHDDFSLIERAEHLKQQDVGLWSSMTEVVCSYPEDGQDRYFSIEDDSFWFRHRNKCIIEAVKKFPPAGVILDVGGGNGFVSFGLNEAGFPSILLEPNKKAVKNAMQRGVSPVVCSTIEDAGFQERSVPAAGLFDVLEHIEHETEFLRLLNGVLCPGGRLYVTVPGHQMLWSLDDEYARHYRRYNRKSLVRSLMAGGYVVDYVTHLFSYLSIPLFFMKMLRSKSHFAKMNTDEDCVREHTPKSVIVNKALSVFHGLELSMIRHGMPLLLGSSLIAVAHSEDRK